MLRVLCLLSIPMILSACAGADGCPAGQVLDQARGVCVLEGTLDTGDGLDTDGVVDTEEPVDVEPEPEPELECGSNAHAVGDDCECLSGFDWCTASPLEDDCCLVEEPEPEPEPAGPLTFNITVHTGEISTTDIGGDDWDVWPYEEPDAFFVAEVNGSEAFVSSGGDDAEDTFSPSWEESYSVTLEPGDTMTLTFWDGDLIDGDDLIQVFDFTYDDLADAAGGAPVTTTGTYVVSFSMSVSI